MRLIDTTRCRVTEQAVRVAYSVFREVMWRVVFAEHATRNTKMSLPIKLISTDFDGTIFAEFENPPIPVKLQQLIGELQSQGAKWVINTGRDMSSLMEALGRAKISVEPDYLVLVEREIHCHDGVRFVGLEEWNAECTRSHEQLFQRIIPDLPGITDWINARFHATVYQDPF